MRDPTGGNVLARLRLVSRSVLPALVGPVLRAPGVLRDHQRLALEWLCHAQDVAADGGVAAGFHLKDGWLPSYPETTGYIACTFFDLAPSWPQLDLARRAGHMIAWLLTQQFAEGGFPGGFGRRQRGPCLPTGGPIVFNTGQILLGLVHACARDPTRRDVRAAADRAARWLMDVMDDDGCWRRHTFNGVVHSYNARTAWALLRYHELTGSEAARDAARRNLRWTLSVQHADGFFDHAGFHALRPPFLHTIAYTIEGVLAAGLLLPDDQLVDAAARAARVLAGQLAQTDTLAGAYRPGWRSAGRYRCLTGEAQMAVVWAHLFERTRDPTYREACERAVRFVAATQVIDGPAAVRGAIAGSHPIWGRYSRFAYPNWAAKFFVDAIAAYGRSAEQDRSAAPHAPPSASARVPRALAGTGSIVR